MQTWSPLTLFVAQYLFAFLASLFAQLLVNKEHTIWQKLGAVGKHGLIGGTCSPIFSAMTPMPAEVVRAEKILFWSSALGGGLVAVPTLRTYLKTLLGNGNNGKEE